MIAKGKTFTYVLIICVAAVWGLIIYRVYAGMSEEDDVTPIVSTPKVPFFKMVDHQQDAVELDLNYRDPFLASAGYETVQEQKSNLPSALVPQQIQSNRSAMPKPQVNWSTVQYTGFVNNPDTKSKMALVAINGNSALLREGQSAHGLKLLKNLGDSLKVQFQGETKFIKIK